MQAERLMTKMTARGVSISGVGGGGMVHISAVDVAAALAFANVGHDAERLVRCMYCGDTGNKPLLDAALVHVGRKVCKRHGLCLSVAPKLVNLALDELRGGSRCSSCAGRGLVGMKVCQSCEGSGLRAMTDSARARLLGLPRSTFVDTYRAAADAVYGHIADLEQRALRALVQQFREAA